LSNAGLWRGRSVFVTGHTGFKGGWLTLWLHKLGAKVHGYALKPPTHPALFDVAAVGTLLATDTRADIADLDQLKASLKKAQPEIVFHLAAQPLVRESYRDPIRTLRTNVLGTAHVLEAARTVGSVRAMVLITTDKVYENRESMRPYREEDPLGGRDPYSASKAAAELVVASYRATFFEKETGHPANVATARAGNVIGGGDWAGDRLVPDCVRAFAMGDSVHLRLPEAVRPWQHVLEPVSGYMQLAQHLLGGDGAKFAKAWNFGPDETNYATVGQVADTMARLWGKNAKVEHAPSIGDPHEAGLLRLDSTNAHTDLGWNPRWSLTEALTQTVGWYQAWQSGADMGAVCSEQIEAFEAIGGS
jgi:CDP-glucose 4,6-dehydratase